MGINNSKHAEQVKNNQTNNQPEYEKQMQDSMIVKNIESDTNKLYDDIFRSEPKIEIITYQNGLSMPYLVDKNTFNSEKYDNYLSSENPKYIELIVCKGNMDDFVEKYAINKNTPDHDCGKNCHCIEETYEIVGNDVKIYQKNKYAKNSTESINRNMYSPTSEEPVNKTNMYSPTSEEPVSKNKISIKKYKYNKSNIKNNTFSPTSVDQSNESKYAEFSPTSADQTDGYDYTKYSPTSTDPITSTKNIHGFLKGGAKKDNIDSSITSENKKKKDDDSSITSENQKSKNNIKGKKNMDDEIDEGDEDLEGLEDEDITEDGFMLSQTDITTSDLYNLQANVFRSHTPDRLDTMNNMSRYQRNRYNSDHYDEPTEKENEAMSRIEKNKRFGMYDSEDDAIFQTKLPTDRNKIESTTEKYINRPTKRNEKYY